MANNTGGGSGVGAAILTITTGGILVYSALTGLSIPDVLRGIKGDPLNAHGPSPYRATPNKADQTVITPSDWTAPAGGAHSFKGPKSTILNGLAGVAQNQFHLTITATTNGTHVFDSYHYRGEAFDASGSEPDMKAFAQYVVNNYGTVVTELIHNPGFAYKNGMEVSPLFYAQVWEGHKDHVHVAMA